MPEFIIQIVATSPLAFSFPLYTLCLEFWAHWLPQWDTDVAPHGAYKTATGYLLFLPPLEGASSSQVPQPSPWESLRNRDECLRPWTRGTRETFNWPISSLSDSSDSPWDTGAQGSCHLYLTGSATARTSLAAEAGSLVHSFTLSTTATVMVQKEGTSHPLWECTCWQAKARAEVLWVLLVSFP